MRLLLSVILAVMLRVLYADESEPSKEYYEYYEVEDPGKQPETKVDLNATNRSLKERRNPVSFPKLQSLTPREDELPMASPAIVHPFGNMLDFGQEFTTKKDVYGSPELVTTENESIRARKKNYKTQDSTSDSTNHLKKGLTLNIPTAKGLSNENPSLVDQPVTRSPYLEKVKKVKVKPKTSIRNKSKRVFKRTQPIKQSNHSSFNNMLNHISQLNDQLNQDTIPRMFNYRKNTRKNTMPVLTSTKSLNTGKRYLIDEQPILNGLSKMHGNIPSSQSNDFPTSEINTRYNSRTNPVTKSLVSNNTGNKSSNIIFKITLRPNTIWKKRLVRIPGKRIYDIVANYTASKSNINEEKVLTPFDASKPHKSNQPISSDETTKTSLLHFPRADNHDLSLDSTKNIKPQVKSTLHSGDSFTAYSSSSPSTPTNTSGTISNFGIGLPHHFINNSRIPDGKVEIEESITNDTEPIEINRTYLLVPNKTAEKESTYSNNNSIEKDVHLEPTIQASNPDNTSMTSTFKPEGVDNDMLVDGDKQNVEPFQIADKVDQPHTQTLLKSNGSDEGINTFKKYEVKNISEHKPQSDTLVNNSYVEDYGGINKTTHSLSKPSKDENGQSQSIIENADSEKTTNQTDLLSRDFNEEGKYVMLNSSEEEGMDSASKDPRVFIDGKNPATLQEEYQPHLGYTDTSSKHSAQYFETTIKPNDPNIQFRLVNDTNEHLDQLHLQTVKPKGFEKKIDLKLQITKPKLNITQIRQFDDDTFVSDTPRQQSEVIDYNRSNGDKLNPKDEEHELHNSSVEISTNQNGENLETIGLKHNKTEIHENKHEFEPIMDQNLHFQPHFQVVNSTNISSEFSKPTENEIKIYKNYETDSPLEIIKEVRDNNTNSKPTKITNVTTHVNLQDKERQIHISCNETKTCGDNITTTKNHTQSQPEMIFEDKYLNNTINEQHLETVGLGESKGIAEQNLTNPTVNTHVVKTSNKTLPPLVTAELQGKEIEGEHSNEKQDKVEDEEIQPNLGISETVPQNNEELLIPKEFPGGNKTNYQLSQGKNISANLVNQTNHQRNLTLDFDDNDDDLEPEFSNLEEDKNELRAPSELQPQRDNFNETSHNLKQSDGVNETTDPDTVNLANPKPEKINDSTRGTDNISTDLPSDLQRLQQSDKVYEFDQPFPDYNDQINNTQQEDFPKQNIMHEPKTNNKGENEYVKNVTAELINSDDDKGIEEELELIRNFGNENSPTNTGLPEAIGNEIGDEKNKLDIKATTNNFPDLKNTSDINETNVFDSVLDIHRNKTKQISFFKKHETKNSTLPYYGETAKSNQSDSVKPLMFNIVMFITPQSNLTINHLKETKIGHETLKNPSKRTTKGNHFKEDHSNLANSNKYVELGGFRNHYLVKLGDAFTGKGNVTIAGLDGVDIKPYPQTTEGTDNLSNGEKGETEINKHQKVRIITIGRHSDLESPSRKSNSIEPLNLLPKLLGAGNNRTNNKQPSVWSPETKTIFLEESTKKYNENDHAKRQAAGRNNSHNSVKAIESVEKVLEEPEQKNNNKNELIENNHTYTTEAKSITGVIEKIKTITSENKQTEIEEVPKGNKMFQKRKTVKTTNSMTKTIDYQ